VTRELKSSYEDRAWYPARLAQAVEGALTGILNRKDLQGDSWEQRALRDAFQEGAAGLLKLATTSADVQAAESAARVLKLAAERGHSFRL